MRQGLNQSCNKHVPLINVPVPLITEKPVTGLRTREIMGSLFKTAQRLL